MQNMSLKQAVTAAQAHVTPNDKATARLIDQLQAENRSLVEYQFYVRHGYWPDRVEYLGDL